MKIHGNIKKTASKTRGSIRGLMKASVGFRKSLKAVLRWCRSSARHSLLTWPTRGARAALSKSFNYLNHFLVNSYVRNFFDIIITLLFWG